MKKYANENRKKVKKKFAKINKLNKILMSDEERNKNIFQKISSTNYIKTVL